MSIYLPEGILAPLSTLDHNIVHWLPLTKDAINTLTPKPKPIKHLVRRYPRSGIEVFGRWACSKNWFDELSDNPGTDELVTSFSSQVTNALNNIFPLKTVKLHHTDKPWITPSIKQLIKDRQKAFYRGDKQQWQLLKCKVQSEIKQRKEMFYKDKIQHLRKDNCRKWWNAVNKMSGRSRKNTSFSLERDGKILSDSELVNSLNSFYTSVNADIPPLDCLVLPAFLPAPDTPPIIEPSL